MASPDIFPAAGRPYRLPYANIVVAAVFFALSLAPSLLPRAPVTQGLLSGISAAIGYGLGAGGLWLWRFLELPRAPEAALRPLRWIAGLGTLAVVTYFVVQTAHWQNDLRNFLGLEPLTGSYLPVVGLVALPLALGLIVLGHGFAWLVRRLARWLDRFLPRRVSMIVGLVAGAIIVANIASGLLGHFAIQSIDTMLRHIDQLIDDDLERPADPVSTGGPQSLISWEQLGRRGRYFVAHAPTRSDIEAFSGGSARQPLRVYVGLGAADTPEQRAALALEEMKRVGAFDRSVVVIATPTGTGWIDEPSVDAIEYLHRGDTAIVGMQYSYLSSYVSVFLEPGYAQISAAALFRAVHGYWRQLPRETRPKLYLNGLSLGSYGSERSLDVYEILGDLVSGAVWSGPTNANPVWSRFVRGRNPDSPPWLPKIGDSSLVRFRNQVNNLDIPGAEWGPMRVVYIQYASDPVTFFSADMLVHEPEWLSGPRGPDVSPNLRWYPIVTGLQVAFDMVDADSLGAGIGHRYAAADYIDAWIAVTQPAGWTEAEIARLKSHLAGSTRP